MNEPRRRRRSGDEPPGGLPLLPLIVLVILAGLLLGGVLAHFFGQSNPSSAPVATNEPAAATPSYTPALPPPATAAATSTPAASPKASPQASSNARATPTAHPTPSQSPTPKTSPTVTLTVTPPTPSTTPAGALSASPAAVASPSGTVAVSVVRSYLSALARGDRATAASYLAHGAPTESYMNPSARIESMRVAAAGARQYQVTAAVESGGTEYYSTFTLSPGPNGLVITDHYTIKPQ